MKWYSNCNVSFSVKIAKNHLDNWPVYKKSANYSHKFLSNPWIQNNIERRLNKLCAGVYGAVIFYPGYQGGGQFRTIGENFIPPS